MSETYVADYRSPHAGGARSAEESIRGPVPSENPAVTLQASNPASLEV
jgi:hypothetical protein